jgi:hypothetical protein
MKPKQTIWKLKADGTVAFWLSATELLIAPNCPFQPCSNPTEPKNSVALIARIRNLASIQLSTAQMAFDTAKWSSLQPVRTP